ncbi:MAG: helix-turn-helix transcriptional regulator [Roseburia sp.]|nr:helix-turn-helix transcriptional regulator [Roseburia sp.]
MQLNLGIKIRELRRRDGRTQEAIAEALGVTPQAVSRWESGGSYPDMEMMPSIANYFGVTIDELFGYHNDREEKINAIIDKADKAIRAVGNILEKGNGDLSECVEMLRAASEEFPNEPRILVKLGDVLHILGWQRNGAQVSAKDSSDYIYDDIEYNSQNVYWQEALRVYEKLLKMDISEEYRGAAIFTMIMIYKMTGHYKKAKELANEQNSIVLSKEVLLPNATVGEEKDKYQGEKIIALLQELYIAISDSVATKISMYTTEYGRNVLLALVNLFETVFSDGRFGSQHMDMRYLYLALANYEAQYGGDIQKSLEYFEKGFEHHKEYCGICNMGDYSYSAPLVSNVTISGKKFPSVPENFWKSWMENVPKNICDELRKNEKYAECFE